MAWQKPHRRAQVHARLIQREPVRAIPVLPHVLGRQRVCQCRAAKQECRVGAEVDDERFGLVAVEDPRLAESAVLRFRRREVCLAAYRHRSTERAARLRVQTQQYAAARLGCDDRRNSARDQRESAQDGAPRDRWGGSIDRGDGELIDVAGRFIACIHQHRLRNPCRLRPRRGAE
jgi:hypothetical protein